MSRLVCTNTKALSGATVRRAHLRARPRRSVRSRYRTTCTVRTHLLQDSLMSHRVCLLHHPGSQDFQLHRLELLFPLPIMVCATSVVNQVTMPGTAIRIRINWYFLQLAVETTNPATTMPSLLVVFMPTTWISMKRKTSLLL